MVRHNLKPSGEYAVVMTRRRFLLMDRDGTLIMERRYLSHPDQVELIPGAAHSLRTLAEAGVGIAVVTNQSGVGRGYFDLSAVDRVHDRIDGLLRAEGVVLDGIYVCPHLPEDACGCRKPDAGLIDQVVRDFDIDPAASFVVGDNWADIELGHRIGALTILVRTGHGLEAHQDVSLDPDHVVDDLPAAAALIIEILARRD